MAGRDLAEPAELAEAEAEQAEQMAERETENEQPEAEGLELRPQATLEFPDRREERNRRGMIKFRLENGVPDVGGLGWRSRAGHLLKNQTFYASRPGENQWNNPTHAGPRTWRSYHGPKLRTDADLMERMDRIEAQHAQWEAKKAFVNTVRVQTLDRFYGRKIENEQKEMASQWAPHRRARGEYHKYHETMTSNLDSMPMKELKKVLTPTVLHGDREAIRSITKRIQTEETWKVAWKHMELARRAETQADFEHRMTYNAMLMELAGQAPRLRAQPRHDILKRQDSHGPPMLCSCGPHVLSLKDPSLLAEHSQHQFLPTSAPPAPDQGKMLLQEPNAVDSLHMSLEFPPRSDHTSQSGSLHSKDVQVL
eukprot:s6598_g1.t1